MNAATAWAVEKSAASGAERAVLFAIARRAIGCVAVCDPHEIMREVRIQRSLYYDCLVPLEKLRELERRTQSSDNAKLRTFHLPKFCQSCCAVCSLAPKTESAPVDGGKLSSSSSSLTTKPDSTESAHPKTLADSVSCGKPTQKKGQLGLFPDVLTPMEARDLCEDCRGTGWRTTEKGAIPCRHAQARFAGRWKMADAPVGHDILVARELKRFLAPHPARPLPEQFRLAG
jgi:hypothetical protein